MARLAQVRDPVHNFVSLRELEVKLIGTRLFQRLRGIRQLAMANLVYPGALHTRFEHSLGVCHVAGMLAEQLDMSHDEIELLRLSALLHDLGHGPFSHISEHALERYSDRANLDPQQKKETIHELITAHMIRTDPEIVGELGQNQCDRIGRLLTSGYGRPAAKQIVSGPLDADKQDYLLRDSRFCGVTYGTFDIHQLHRSLVLEGPEDEEELMIDPDGIHAVEQYVLAKYYLTTNVYRHRVRLITDQMIVRAIRLGIDKDDITDLRRLYSYDASAQFIENYSKWDDASFLMRFADDSSPQTRCGELLQRLRHRRLLKRVFSSQIKDFADPSLRDLLSKLDSPANDDLREKLESAIAGILSRQTEEQPRADFIIAHAYTIKSVRTTSRNDEAGIMVARHPRPRPFEDESALFASINEGYTEGYLDVYAPISWDPSTDKKRMRRELEKPIREAIENLCPNQENGAT